MMADPRETWRALQPLGTPDDPIKIEAFVEGWKAHAAQPYETLGDIQDTLRKMKGDGMTLSAIIYVLERVYWQEVDVVESWPAFYKETQR